MDRERFLKMDKFMALSWINTKLRDNYSDLESLCEDLEFEPQEVKDKFLTINYTYLKDKNKFA